MSSLSTCAKCCTRERYVQAGLLAAARPPRAGGRNNSSATEHGALRMKLVEAGGPAARGGAARQVGAGVHDTPARGHKLGVDVGRCWT